MRWIVTDVPTWLAGLLLLVCLPLLACLVHAAMRKWSPSIREGNHNDVAGFLVAVVAVVYAVIVGFTIVSLDQASAAANNDVSTEASMLLELNQDSLVLGHTTSTNVQNDIVYYAQSVIKDWPIISLGESSALVQRATNDLYKTYAAYHPASAADSDYLQSAIDDLNGLQQARVQRQLEASEAGSLPLVLWLGILICSLVTLSFTLIFGIENAAVSYFMVGGVALVLAVNLFVIIELAYPFLGSVAVGPGRFAEVIAHIQSLRS